MTDIIFLEVKLCINFGEEKREEEEERREREGRSSVLSELKSVSVTRTCELVMFFARKRVSYKPMSALCPAAAYARGLLQFFEGVGPSSLCLPIATAPLYTPILIPLRFE